MEGKTWQRSHALFSNPTSSYGFLLSTVVVVEVMVTLSANQNLLVQQLVVREIKESHAVVKSGLYNLIKLFLLPLL